MCLCRFRVDAGPPSWGWIVGSDVCVVGGRDVRRVLSGRAAEPLDALSAVATPPVRPLEEVRLLAPVIEPMEVWAAGVTYESSKLARMAESAAAPDAYARVYMADRPELFFKARPSRVSGPLEPVRRRADSAWTVPEPELAVLFSASGTVLGYAVGNDITARDIEGANPLYLPQAKIYEGSCALGPWWTPAGSVSPAALGVDLEVRRGDEVAFRGHTSTSCLRRTSGDLVEWLLRELRLPAGGVLLTGTGIVPPDAFSLRRGDVVSIWIEGLGRLDSPVH